MLSLFPDERPEYPDGNPDGDRAELSLNSSARFATAYCRLNFRGQGFVGRAAVATERLTDKLTRDRLLQRAIKLSFYRAALKSGVSKPSWGALTGVRPGKLMSALLAEGFSENKAVAEFCKLYDVSEDRARLCLGTAAASGRAAAKLMPRDICLYVGIPFCPSRCAYCSFVSASVEKSLALTEPFLSALFLEIDACAEQISGSLLNVVSVYLGGGTPTTLSARQLDGLLTKLSGSFDLSRVREITVEAGRPDTITEEKLRV
jgi:oxygen-independent coproporphyrinogen-3 oxidase